MERFPLKSSVPKMGTTYQSVYKKGNGASNGRGGVAEGDMVDITPAPLRAADCTPTSHGTFQLYEHGGRSSDASATSYIAQYFNSAAGKT